MRAGKGLLIMLVCVMFAALASGCIAVPIISGLRDMGVTPDARRELLTNDLRVFHSGMQSSNLQVVLNYVDSESPELKERLRDELRTAKRKEKLVESATDFVDYSDDATEATVEMRVRYFRVPYYVVKDRIETEKWVFNAGSGWKLKSRDVKDVVDDE